jgi:hypothetical protein
MPGLHSTKHIVSSRQITATLEEALAKLEPDAMITMNPVVHSFTRVPDQSIAAPDSKYRIVDRLAFLGTHFDTTYEAVFHPRADGLDIEVSAGMGTRLKTTWTVRGVGEGTVEVTEDVNVRVSLRAHVKRASPWHRPSAPLCPSSRARCRRATGRPWIDLSRPSRSDDLRQWGNNVSYSVPCAGLSTRPGSYNARAPAAPPFGYRR